MPMFLGEAAIIELNIKIQLVGKSDQLDFTRDARMKNFVVIVTKLL